MNSQPEEANEDIYNISTDSDTSNLISSETSEEGKEIEDLSSPRKKKVCRKRMRQPHLHKRFISKENVERGRERITSSGKIIKAKKFISQTLCQCKLDCPTKIDPLRQEEIFNSYYQDSNRAQKVLLLRSFVDKVLVKCRNETNRLIIPIKRHDFNFEYYLTDSLGVRNKVCTSFFYKCIQISKSALHRAINSSTSNPSGTEKRGKSSSANRTPDFARSAVRSFINRFPAYESHYGRSSSQKKYLNPNLNLAQMYRMYKEQCDNENIQPVSETIFREIFNEDFNLSFKRPHSDTCKTCDSFKAQLQNDTLSAEKKEEILKTKENHQFLDKKIKEEFKNDVLDASEDTVVLTFDLQKVLETPSLTTGIAFYKRQLSTYNLCIYDETDQRAYMYVWSENVASRGGQEVGSCLLKHLKNHIKETTKHVILYSDSCGGQNRNIKVSLMLKHFLASSNIELIEHKFYMSGHSYNGCDRNFGYIEKERRNIEAVNDPDHWIHIIKNTRKNEPKFIVTKMETSDFFTSQELEEHITNRKKDVNKDNINWLKARSLKHDKEQPFYLFMTYDDETVQRVDIGRKHVTEEDFRDIELSLLFPNGRTITKQKFNDLMALMEFIPQRYRHFYQNLRTNDSSKDYDFVSDDSD